MDELTLREAARRTSRSITTLRRYIRSGRLRAEKKMGRFGPEYFVSDEALQRAGIQLESGTALATLPNDQALERIINESVPATLFQELQMKHEQLLVQYGMMRASGMKMLELRDELDQAREALAGLEAELSSVRETDESESARLKKRLRTAELELEARRLENSALREKVRGLEMLTRNAVTSESIERQFSALTDQLDRVDEMETRRRQGPTDDWPRRRPLRRDH